MKYCLYIKPNQSSDVSNEEYNFVVNDIALSLVERLGIDAKTLRIESSCIAFESDISEEVIKGKLRDVFSYHFDVVRYNGVERLL